MASNRELIPVTAQELRDGDTGGSLMPGRRVIGLPRVRDDGRVEVHVQWSRTGRKERLAIDPAWKGRVQRAVVGPGKPIRWRGKARTTRELVEVLDTAHPEAHPELAGAARGDRWALRCKHGTIVGRTSLKAATEDAEDPRLWCVRCCEEAPVRQMLPL